MDQLSQQEEDQLVVVPFVSQVTGKSLQRKRNSYLIFHTWRNYFESDENFEDPSHFRRNGIFKKMLKQSKRTYFTHGAHHRVFLGVDERFEHDANGHVDVIFDDIVAEMHFRVSFRKPNHTFDVTNCDRNTSCHLLQPAKRNQFDSISNHWWWNSINCNCSGYFLNLQNFGILWGSKELFRTSWID